MTSNICKKCGAPLIYDDGIFKCKYCGLIPEDAMISSDERLKIAAASLQLDSCHFDDAEEQLRNIVKAYPNNSESRWLLVLAKFNFKYEKDENTGKNLPTCFATKLESFLEDRDYLKALEISEKNKDIQKSYIEQANEIERLRKEWIEITKKEPKYDIFLCYKETEDETKQKTKDSDRVKDLYILLKDKGYKVFFAPISLSNRPTINYEAYIFNAVFNSSIMIVYGSKPEYFSSTWMENEWQRFSRKISNKEKVIGSLIVVCDGCNPSDLPPVLKKGQCLNAEDFTFKETLENHIQNTLTLVHKPENTIDRIQLSNKNSKKKNKVSTGLSTIQIQSSINKKTKERINKNIIHTREIGGYEAAKLTVDEKTKIQNIFKAISYNLYDKTKEQVQEILEKNPYNGSALLAEMLIENKQPSLEMLSINIQSIYDFNKIHLIIQYNEKEIGEQILKMICSIIKNKINKNDYVSAIDYFKEVAIYNDETINELKEYLLSITYSIIKTYPRYSYQIFRILMDTYQDNDSYNFYKQKYIQKVMDAGEFEIAKELNEEILQNDLGNLISVWNHIYIDLKVNNKESFYKKFNEFKDYNYLANALEFMDEQELQVSFALLESLAIKGIRDSIDKDALNRLVQFIIQYDYSHRNSFMNEITDILKDLKNTQLSFTLFNTILKYIDSNNVDMHIQVRNSLTSNLLEKKEYKLAIQYISEVLEIEEGNEEALFNLLLAKNNVSTEEELLNNIQDFNTFEDLKLLFSYSLKGKDLLNKMILSVLNKMKIEQKEIEKLSKLFEELIRYFPKKENKQLIHHLYAFAYNCKEVSKFDLASKYYLNIISINPKEHKAYWGLLQSSLKCKNNDDLIHCSIKIEDRDEFYNATLTADGDGDSQNEYFSVASKQQEYFKELERIEEEKRKKRLSICKTCIACAAIVVAVFLLIVAYVSIHYYSNNGKLEYKWDFSIELNAGSGELSDTSVTVRKGREYILPIPTKDGYEFVGWFDELENQLTNNEGVSLEKYKYDESIFLIAHYKANENKLIFNSNATNTTGFMETLTVATDSSVTLPSCNFNRDGYTFAGWGINQTEVYYLPNEQYMMGPKSEYNLYAIWEKIYEGYEYIYDYNDLCNIKNHILSKYILINDIYCTGDWTPINTFHGELNGNGHTINNLNIKYSGDSFTSEVSYGLFRELDGPNALVHNLTFNNVTISIEIASSKEVLLNCGTVCGKLMNGARIEQVTIKNIILTAKSATDKKNINKKVYVGGFTGTIDGLSKINSCNINGKGFSNSYIKGYSYASKKTGSTGDCWCYAGGIVGYASSINTIENCTRDDSVSVESYGRKTGYNSASHCYAGGIVGYLENKTITSHTNTSSSNNLSYDVDKLVGDADTSGNGTGAIWGNK